MNDSTPQILDAETASALFANMVLQQTNMALIFLGKAPNPETGEVIHDLQTARMLIDQLEMLAMKTKGNLDAHESALMNQSLAAVRMAFVEAVEQPSKTSPQPSTALDRPTEPAPSSQQEQASPGPGEDAESRKKFSKKY
jgi:hypothetical protein